MHLTLKQGADFPPAHDSSPTGVLAKCCLQYKQWNATGHQKEDVRNEECTCNDNLAVFDQDQMEQCLSVCLSVRIHLTHLDTQHIYSGLKNHWCAHAATFKPPEPRGHVTTVCLLWMNLIHLGWKVQECILLKSKARLIKCIVYVAYCL